VDLSVGAEAKRLLDILGDKWTDSNNSPYEMLFDCFQPYNSVAHSIGVIGLRACDVSEGVKGTSRFVRTLAIIPGPRQPAKYAAYLLRTLLKFAEFGLGPSALTVTERVLRPDGVVVSSRTFEHRPFLAAVLADSPAR
jgi:hypothetical protein